jgi:catechol 2,3-dioxygenase-like lactoylglutathione lyase family enzyme
MTGSPEMILQVADLEAASEFYQHHLGLSVFLRQPNLIGLDAGAFRLYLEQGPPLGPVFEFFVPDLQQAKAGLSAAGCEIIDDNPTIPRCYVRDPFGVVFNLAEKKPADG